MRTGIVKSSDNSTSVALGAAGTFVGVGEDISSFAEVTVNLAGAPSVAAGTIYFEYSPDGTNWDVSVPTVISGPNSFVPLPLRTVLPFFRVRYVNGATPLTQLRLTTVLHWESAKHITRVINQTIDENEPVENVRAFIGGRSPDGPFTNVPANGVASELSTNTPLGISGVFTSPVISVLGFVAVSIAIKSNVNSAAGGLSISFYADEAGTRLVKAPMFTYGGAPDGTSFQVPAITGCCMRVTYTNGAVAQTVFELLAVLSVTAPPSDVLSVNETINGNTAAQVVKANIVGQREDGTYSNSKLSNSNSQLVAITDRPSEVRGRVAVEIVDSRRSLAASPGTLLRTVTPGYALYISSIVVTALNDANAIGEWHIADNLTPKMPFLLSNKATGAPSASVAPSPFLPEPVVFLTSVRLIEVSGDIITAVTLIGYEEPL